MVHAVLDNERINTILRITEASEDAISEALFAPLQDVHYLFFCLPFHSFDKAFLFLI